MRAAIYVRVSSEGQAGDNVSPAKQEERCRERCDDRGYEIQGVYKDVERYKVNGIGPLKEPSSHNADRPGYLALIEAIKAGQVDRVVAFDEYRIGGDYEALYPFYMAIKYAKQGVKYEVLDPAGDEWLQKTHKNMGTTASGGEARTDLISKTLTEGRVGALERGFIGGGSLPYGYERQRVTVTEGSKKRDRIVPVVNEDESQVVQRVLDWTTKDWPYAKMVSELARLGYRPRDAKHLGITLFPIATLRKIVGNAELYCTGDWEYELKGKPYPLALPPIVTKSKLPDILKARDKHRQFRHRETKHVYLLNGLIRSGCSRGDSSWWLVTPDRLGKAGKVVSNARYRCARHMGSATLEGRSEDCGKSYTVEELDSLVWSEVVARYFSIATAYAEADKALESYRQDGDKTANELQAILSAIEANNRQVKKLLMRDDVDDPITKEAIAGLKAEKVGLEARESMLRHRLEIVGHAVDTHSLRMEKVRELVWNVALADANLTDPKAEDYGEVGLSVPQGMGKEEATAFWTQMLGEGETGKAWEKPTGWPSPKQIARMLHCDPTAEAIAEAQTEKRREIVREVVESVYVGAMTARKRQGKPEAVTITFRLPFAPNGSAHS